ncbi:hypothetical protein FOCC_FOCC017812 [Frankliniella occidentalis]|nr:hypothetical protein FOCC_FOCC017812 [Frankliniella occidentalis]
MELPPENTAAEVVDPSPPLAPANRLPQASDPDADQNGVDTEDPLAVAVDAEDEFVAAPREANSTRESLWPEHVPATPRSSSLDWDAAGLFFIVILHVPGPRRFTPSAPGSLRSQSCSDCPPPLVRSVETGECELPVSRDSESDAAPAESALSFAPVLTRSDSATSRPKFKVNCEPTDDGDLLTAIAELACRLEEGADLTETSDTDAMTSDDEAKVGPRGPESEHSDDGSSSRNSETGLEGRTVTAAEAETLSRTLSVRADAEASKRDPDPVVCLVVSGTFGVGLSFADSSALVLGLSSVSVAINSMGIGHISSIVVELFPTHLRAMAVSLHLMAGRTGSIAGNLIFGLLLSTNCAFAFYAIGGALLTCAVLSCLLPARGKYAA